MPTKPFVRILIANRGEIAVRVMRTCRSMGISTVAVYSDADARSPHVRLADEAVHIGPAPSKDSYLNVQKIIDAAKRTKADAIHPGYGFLSENADFAEACEAAGLTFIGPAPEVIRKMGLKNTARQIMSSAGVPVVPGYDGEDQSPAVLHEKAMTIGLPVLIKASAGGGGKGMRVIRDQNELADSIEAARREAEKAFGDGTLLIEKYIENARHIEVQILGDHHDNLIHLFERECSIQRRHQKIIEETPSPALSSELRERLCETAITAGRAIGYTNAGTVEFILAPSGEFYFIEVNTRLQVEHPITEMITGLDLVRLQIEIAEGRSLSIAQDDVKQAGHAIEARLYAEDPANGFLPATGTILDWRAPVSIRGLRIDSGVELDTEVGIHYDPMLAKVIARAADREAALQKLVYGLQHLSVLGVATNRELLIRILEHSEFQSGQYHTDFVTQHLDELIAGDRDEDTLVAAVVASYLHRKTQDEANVLPKAPLHYRNNPFRDPSIKLQVAGVTHEVSWKQIAHNEFTVSAGDWQANLRLVSSELPSERGKVGLEIDGIQRTFRIAEASDQFFVQSGSLSRVVTRLSRYPRPAKASEHESAFAPMPGQVLKILVAVGQQVSAGAALVVLEAMKMEQTLRASTDGVVEAILVKPGDVVAPGDTLVEIKALTTDEHR
ncbi:MAG TPA: acetyl-CoA carboxylase biotin carboxylase subunit [Blastocatellia bacterium]|nr:acetyl-CoA carboxylase biotin carboxylase subunit [Blastocatellia bacterium]